MGMTAASSDGYSDRYFWSQDGLRLHYRAYPGPAGITSPVVLCLPGLTRNVRDFDALARRLSTRLPVWCLELRGRGESAFAKDPLTYVPLVYLRDIERLIEDAHPRKLLVIGTSLGGILGMLMAGTMHEHLAGVLLNDIGPEIEAEGLKRIRGYVGRGGPWPTWMHAARDLAESSAAIFPDWGIEQWLAHAKRLCRVQPSGRIALDYDPRIAEPFKLPGGEAGVDLWPAFQALAGLPVASLRGETSDILSARVQDAMARRLPGLETTVVPRVGHAPSLDEPESLAAIDGLIERVLAATAAA